MSKPGGDPSSGISSGDALILPERHPACRRREARQGSCTERENLHGDAKGKGTSGANREPKVPMRRLGADCSVVVVKRGNARGAKGAGHRHWPRVNRQREEPDLNGRRQPACDGTSRMTRECQVRICGRLGVKFPGPCPDARSTVNWRHWRSSRPELAAGTSTLNEAAGTRRLEFSEALQWLRSARTTSSPYR